MPEPRDSDMTRRAARKLRDGAIVVLPLGATEQHGPHLPFETDAIIAEGVCRRAAAMLPAGLQVEFLPVERIGYSPEHLGFHGSLSLRWDEAVRRWIGIGEAAAARGARRVVMLNAHGGNSPLMTVVATELRVRKNMLAVATSWTRFGFDEALVPAREKALGIHGGLAETSVMLALRPDLVDMDKAADFASAQAGFEHDFRHLRAYGPHAFGWKMEDLSTEGVVGNAAGASAEIGEKLLHDAAKGFVELLGDVAKFDVASLG
jgi:creatinine amidohydrolase